MRLNSFAPETNSVAKFSPAKRFEPREVRGNTKYGQSGNFTKDSFKKAMVSDDVKELLAKTANQAIAKKTWSTYSTAVRALHRCSEETNADLSFPLDESKTLTFVGWLVKRGLAGSTINSYLSGIRQAHITEGHHPPNLRSPLITQVIEGMKKVDNIKKQEGEKPKRIAMTPLILRTWKAELRISDYSDCDKLMMWAVSTLAFSGTFRCHELLARYNNSFDPQYTLLAKDIQAKSVKINQTQHTIIQVRVKSEKTDRVGVNTIVDVYESGGPLCPVKALEKWRNQSKTQDPELPAFRWKSGKPFTGTDLNKALRKLLAKHFDYEKDKISGHSFRAGLPTLAGQLGFTDTEIQALGRWSSRAFQAYVKLPRTNRLEMARRMAALEKDN